MKNRFKFNKLIIYVYSNSFYLIVSCYYLRIKYINLKIYKIFRNFDLI